MKTPSTTVMVDDQEIVLIAMSLDQAEQVLGSEVDPRKQVRAVVAATLLNGGYQGELGSMPFIHYAKIREAALELNGLAASPAGEAAAPAKA